MYIPLSDNLPLRNSTVWGRYRNYRTLPVVYGTVRLQAVPYDAEGLVYVAADHPISGVDLVEIDGTPYSGYLWRHDQDSTGRAVTFIRLNTPAGSGQVVTVSVRGKMHPLTGELLSNPADVVWDMLGNLCGLPVVPSDFDRFRAECRGSGITVSGALTDARKTIRTTVDEIMLSVGAIWSGGMPGYARLYPL